MKPKKIWKEADRRERKSRKVKDHWGEMNAWKDKAAIISLFSVKKKSSLSQ